MRRSSRPGVTRSSRPGKTSGTPNGSTDATRPIRGNGAETRGTFGGNAADLASGGEEG